MLSKFKEADIDDSFKKDVSIDDEYVRYFGSWLKWYDSYKDVTIINDFINDSTDEHPRGLIAVGEDSATMHYGQTTELDMFEITNVEW